jgi:hypothetical protein
MARLKLHELRLSPMGEIQTSEGTEYQIEQEGFSIVGHVRLPAYDDPYSIMRLLCAAPELLACCRWLLDYAPTGHDAARVRTAIAKATGK